MAIAPAPGAQHLGAGFKRLGAGGRTDTLAWMAGLRQTSQRVGMFGGEPGILCHAGGEP